MSRSAQIPDGYRIPESDDELLAECTVQVFRSSGPGGQSVNTTDSAVRLVHHPTGTRVQCQRERSQLRNKRECLQRLRARLEEGVAAANVQPRVATRPSGAARQRRLNAKRVRATKKRLRKPPPAEE